MTPAPAKPSSACAIELRLRCPDAAEAERLRRALAPDDPGSLGIAVEREVLVLRARSATALGALRTIDDALGGLRAAAPGL